ncbi:DUF1127 domain-containing protein [Bradyrhizobium sp. CB1015]|uniref:DUF1127 domain-containing protein n=1 Tax=Bradyrhizobium sp. CB1015 TaxID=2976822 RepID=UPI0021AAF708|nr:DUF1127 domain-containing protein [Bradyrhizobium sp. CB1015]UWU88976.1 DUF1127 domain-containing protein [Bradyrhizobium sp. CB1015]
MDTISLLFRPDRYRTTRSGVRLIKRCWSALIEWREREKLRSRLSDLSDAELRDIGITRGEVDYASAHPSEDPRGVVSAQGDVSSH